MMWSREARRRLAKIVWDRSVEIDDLARARNLNLRDYISDRDREIPAHFRRLGFEVVTTKDWVYDPSYNHPALFRQQGKHLHFLVCTQNVLKVHVDLAAKILVLGLP